MNETEKNIYKKYFKNQISSTIMLSLSMCSSATSHVALPPLV